MTKFNFLKIQLIIVLIMILRAVIFTLFKYKSEDHDYDQVNNNLLVEM